MAAQMFKTVPVEKAVGMILGHDVTRIEPGKSKGPAFKKGAVIKPEDIPTLLDIGKKHIYVLDLQDDYIHENDAALQIATAVAGTGVKLTGPSEGRVNLVATTNGLLKINIAALNQINTISEIVLATLHTNQQVQKASAVAGTRIIPLATTQEKINAVVKIGRDNYPVIAIKPYRALKVGLIITGSEVFSGRIPDKFGPVVKAKFGALGCPVIKQLMVSDDRDRTVAAIQELLHEDVQLIAITGGMSVDPDDQTPASIQASGAAIVTYGAPTFPGAMFMLARLNDVIIIGLPGCVMYYRSSIFDLIVPRIVAGETVTRKDIIRLGHGGFCSGCPECRYPVCGFGKGV